MKSQKTILGMPVSCFYTIVLICITGIIIGSFADYNINAALANKTTIGSYFATYGMILSYWLYPLAGTCIFKGLRRKSSRYNFLSWVILFISIFIAVYYTNSYSGSKMLDAFGYTAGESSALIYFLCYLILVALYSWIPFVFYHLIDDENPDKLIAVGATILIAGIVSDYMTTWLKQVASRPRYKYLLTIDDPISEYRNWWEMIPNLAGTNDNFKSWPSANMTIACMMFSLPALFEIFKKQYAKYKNVAFVFSCVYVALYSYNRIHMTNHFLSDVCFGTLITYLIFSAVSYGLNSQA